MDSVFQNGTSGVTSTVYPKIVHANLKCLLIANRLKIRMHYGNSIVLKLMSLHDISRHKVQKRLSMLSKMDLSHNIKEQQSLRPREIPESIILKEF